MSASLALPLLLQLLGLNVLCFCGHCPASQILLPSAPAEEAAEHACCHHQQEADDVDASLPVLAGQSCCGDDHTWRPTTALNPEGHAPLPHLAATPVVLERPRLVLALARTFTSQQRFLARGPPPVPIYLQFHSLQI